VVCNGLAFRQLGKRAAFGLQIINQLVAGADDRQGAGIAARRQAVFLEIAACDVAFETDIAECEFGTGRNGYDHGNGRAMVENRVGRQVVDIPPGHGDIDNTAIAGVFIKRCNQPVPVVPCLYQESEIA